jgi:hypothetical protein
MAQLIIMAFGIQFRDSDGLESEKVLKANCDAKAGAPNTYIFPKGAGAKAKYEIRLIFALSDFITAVDTPDAVVVYDGHSRYGQGPCFGPAGIDQMPDAKSFPTNPWNVTYKMGYDATDTDCIGDLVHHSILPTEYDLTSTAPTAFLAKDLAVAATKAKANEKAVKAKKISASVICSTAGAWREFNSCFAKLAGTGTKRGDKPLKDRHFYQVLPRKAGDEFKASITVGSVDVDKSKLPGKLIVMGSCSSQAHFLAALDRRRKAVKSSCQFILTGDVCTVDLATVFLNRVLLKKIDPTTSKGMAQLAKSLNGVDGSGGVGLY